MKGGNRAGGGLEDIAGEVFVFDDAVEAIADVFSVDLDGLAVIHFGSAEGDIFEEAFHDGMESASADVFGAGVDFGPDAGEFVDGVVVEVDIKALGFEESDVLFDQGVSGFFEDTDKVGLGEGFEFNADGEAALHFGDEVRHFGDMEGSSGDEEDVIGTDHAVFGVDGGAFDDGEEVALDTFAGDIGSVGGFTTGDLVDFVEEDDTGLFDALECAFGDLLHVDHFLGLFLDEDVAGFGDFEFAAFGALGEEVSEHIFEVDAHFFETVGGEDFDGGALSFSDIDFDELVFKGSIAEFASEFFAGGVVAGFGVFVVGPAGEKEVEELFFGGFAGFDLDGGGFFFFEHLDGEFGEVADHGFDITSDITDFGELGGFDLEEGGLCEFGETASDLGFSDAGGSDHEDIFGCDLVAEFGGDLLSAPAVSQGDSDGAFCGVLSDDVAVEFANDLAGGEGAGGDGVALLCVVGHQICSITISLLVKTQISAAIWMALRAISGALRLVCRSMARAAASA